MKLLKALSPGLNLDAALAQMATPVQPAPILQIPTIPAPQIPPIAPPTENPNLVETFSDQAAEVENSQASVSETPKFTNPSVVQTTSTFTSKPIRTSPQPEPSRILDDVEKLGIKPTPEVVGGEERTEELRRKLAELRAGVVEGGKVDTERIGGEQVKESEVVVTAEDLGTEKAEVVVEGEKMNESEVVVDADELQAEREREMKTKAGEEPRNVEGIVEEAQESEEESDDEDEVSNESASVSNESRETGEIDSDEGTEILSEGSQEREEEKKQKKECKSVMKKSQVPLMREMEELRKGIRRSRRIAWRSGQK